ncbi:DNA cytosine methyltransferase [Aneurinibacillus aneurinilyticus]|uniref:Cytosine-specific methyltransferase n=2 Tax=Aneurinibacillus aneurinilyticus TaxID=1391 RepID=D9MYV3_ANEAE|nr:DNA cytosine methyltransferase [Aneurinibacillus aneurinilyticus]ADJ68008.1 M.BanII [Aneurinibacillus aneurinilyticus]ERI11867.1 DNA (cytosine-5-)-methyltransferase [Aneurinibacillus aneurinilyticus ATCC 12856]MED0705276.1 DNA cytosine methyltransferase [Aneurinibacillus aneurinilyticus]MED0722476.1 DNA cytosine methyltransferase [Aneurinibacillus aneurinilyticus]MED0733786.1 DNA cytosine methyltransferase [Aneurinibacillus aneurinilyticus]
MKKIYTGISLFSGAGGMDVGFKNAGVKVLCANEIDKYASATYQANNPETKFKLGDIRDVYSELKEFKNIDIIFGGPPCQGFSVAGKMNPDDERSTLVWSFLDVVKLVRPRAFVMENVKALATLEKWKNIRERIIKLSNDMGYSCYPYVLNSSHYGVPQKRERVFFVGFLNKVLDPQAFQSRIEQKKQKAKSVRETIMHLGPAGTDNNPQTCTAKITLATKPVMRKSPYAGMIFNGMGRPLKLDDLSNTLPASMGGNKTPIIDEALLYNYAEDDWIVEYHKALLDKRIEPTYCEAPSRLRRLTIKEAALLQSFPENYIFLGSKSSIYKQIGNAVPCLLAEAIARSVIEELEDIPVIVNEPTQLSLESFIDNRDSFIDVKDSFIDVY